MPTSTPACAGGVAELPPQALGGPVAGLRFGEGAQVGVAVPQRGVGVGDELAALGDVLDVALLGEDGLAAGDRFPVAGRRCPG